MARAEVAPAACSAATTGVFRLLDSSLGAQAGWLLGFALVSGVAVAIGSRLRRGDARTGWLVATGGAFLGCAVTFSAASGIFHPYYVSLLAPFTAALVGGGVGQFLRAERSTLWLAPAAVVLGGFVELVVINNTSGAPAWAKTVIIVTGIVSVAAMVAAASPRVRMVALGVALAGLLAAPASWSAQTLGHATNGTFPAGGPTSAGFGGGPGGGGMGGPPGGGNGTFAPPNGGAAPPGGGTRAGGGGMFGGNSASLTSALAYVKAHGGGTIGVSSQQGAAAAIIESGANVAGLGGFSGRESDVTVAWLKQAVAEGKIRWVLVDGNTGHGPAGRPHRRHHGHGLGPEPRQEGDVRRALRPQLPLRKLTGFVVILNGMDNGNGTHHRVLVVDDEPNIVDVIAMALKFQGFAVESAGTGQEAISQVAEFKPDLIVLDVMLPDMEGFDVAKRLGAARSRVPIIFLTARDATDDKIRGLTLGGDDYVTKPFSLEELVARIRSILRRSGLAEPESSRLVFEDLELDEDAHEVMRGGSHVDLTATEYRLLRYLMLNPRRVLTRAQLLEHVWDYDFGGDARVLETYVSYLRRKLDVHGPPLIHTVRGVGYALRTPRA